MYVRLDACFAIPTESAVCKINMNTIFKKRFPKNCNTFTLRNRICRNQGGTDVCTFHQIGCFFVPTGNIVKITCVLPFRTEHIEQIIFLCFIHQACTNKRRITHNVIQLVFRHDSFPINTESIAIFYICIRLQRQEIKVNLKYFFSFVHHLRLCYPKCCLCNGYSKVVNFNTVKLTDGDLYRISNVTKSKCNLSCDLHRIYSYTNSLVFQTAQGYICFCQEITRTTGGVKERKI